MQSLFMTVIHLPVRLASMSNIIHACLSASQYLEVRDEPVRALLDRLPLYDTTEADE